MTRATFSKGDHYRYGNHLVVVVEDADSPIGKRLIVPTYGKHMGLRSRQLLHQFPPLPKAWRKLIQEALSQRGGERN